MIPVIITSLGLIVGGIQIYSIKGVNSTLDLIQISKESSIKITYIDPENSK